MVVDVATNGTNFTAGTLRELFSLRWPSAIATIATKWQLSVDGSRFLLPFPASGASAPYLDVVINRETLLKRR